jgi:aerobic carbon-monoxide dehydrogenase medium subunit
VKDERDRVKPAPFEYHAPGSLLDALELLSSLGDEAKVLAGGQSLVPMLALRLARFDHLVDLGRAPELRGVDLSDGHVSVGAMTLQREVETDPLIASRLPLLARATPMIGHFQIRNRGTLGGSIAHADPASEYPAVALALGAEMDVVGPAGSRSVRADDFFESTWTTCLAPDEVLRSVRFPLWDGSCGFAIEEVARRHGDFALAGAACAVGLDHGDRVDRAGISLFALGSTPLRAAAAESALIGWSASDLDDDALEEVARLATEDIEPPADIHASSRYRSLVGRRLAARALQSAAKEAREREQTGG